MDRLDIRMFIHTFPEKAAIWVAWKMPKKLVYWCSLRATAEVTSGKWGSEHPDDVSIMDMLKRIGHWA